MNETARAGIVGKLETRKFSSTCDLIHYATTDAVQIAVPNPFSVTKPKSKI